MTPTMEHERQLTTMQHTALTNASDLTLLQAAALLSGASAWNSRAIPVWVMWVWFYQSDAWFVVSWVCCVGCRWWWLGYHGVMSCDAGVIGRDTEGAAPRAVFIDVDGTLCDSRQRVPDW